MQPLGIVIDVHQHLVRLAKHPTIEGFRDQQLQGHNPEFPEIDDETIKASTSQVLNLMAKRKIDIACVSPRAKAMATHVGTLDQNLLWADLNNSLILRAANLLRGKFAPIGMLGQHPSNSAKDCAGQLARWADQGFVAFNFDPDGTGGLWTNPPFTSGQWDELFEVGAHYDVPFVIHGSESVNPNFPHTAIQYLIADMMLYHLLMAKNLFKKFPRLRFIVPHGGGPLGCQNDRWRWLVQMNKFTPLEELVINGNLYFDTCVYSKRNMATLFATVPSTNLVFGSESDGAFPEVINPETQDHADNTKGYIDALGLDELTRSFVFEINARRAYPKMDPWILARVGG